MRLIRLKLQNFRQHEDTELDFRPGLTGIIGPNGSGKTTILEAIAWAIYGTPAIRGTNDTIRFLRAPGGSRVEAELLFALGGQEYRVQRTLKSAQVFVNGGADPVASTIGGVSEYLGSRLGMSCAEFFNTYFTAQKELHFLGGMGAKDRARFLNQVLGYERLRMAQESVRRRRAALKNQVEATRAVLPDPAQLEQKRASAERQLAHEQAALVTAETEQHAAEQRRAALEPAWQKAESARERARELGHQLDMVERDRVAAERDVARTERELRDIAAASGLALPEAPLPELAAACEAEARLAHERVQQELAGAEQQARALELDWRDKRTETETRLHSYRERARELKEQLEQLRAAGPDGVCPTCTRPLGAEFNTVVGKLQDEWDTLVQDGKWLSQRQQQLQNAPGELAAVEAQRGELRRAVDAALQRATRAQRAVGELETLQPHERLRTAAARLAELKAERASIDFEESAYAELRRTRDEAAGAAQQAERTAIAARGRVETARRELEHVRLLEAEYQERAARVAGLELELRHHDELDRAFSQLRDELNAQLRPELGDLAGTFLAELTDGRYRELKIDESYNVLVLDDGEEKPVISGGEEDIVHLVLRLAVSQMIAERAGQPLSLLILDEVFGSLDIDHRDYVIQLLRRLETRFEQVVVITHVEGIREGLDHVIRVDFDEATGASRVVEEVAA